MGFEGTIPGRVLSHRVTVHTRTRKRVRGGNQGGDPTPAAQSFHHCLSGVTPVVACSSGPSVFPSLWCCALSGPLRVWGDSQVKGSSSL